MINKNIVVIGLNYTNVIEFALQVAKSLNYEFINGDEKYLEEVLKFDLQSNQDEFKEIETLFHKNLSKMPNSVIALKDDDFISNLNYLCYANSLTILIEEKQTDKIKKNLQKLLKKHCKITVKYNKLKINDLCDIIRG